jgi:hypothetical protein
MKTLKIYKSILWMLLFTLSAALHAQDEAKAIFTRAVDQLLTNQMDLSIHITTTESDGRSTVKAYDILMGSFGDKDMMRMVMQEPERARGVTIVITQLPGEEGVIEVLTPSNGKVRKMKATPENMERVGTSYILSDYASKSLQEMEFSLSGKEEAEGITCWLVDTSDKKKADAKTARFLIEENSYRIREIRVLDAGGESSSVTKLSQYRPLEEIKGKVQPMHIRTEDLTSNTITEINITRVAWRPDLKKEDFILEGVMQ